MTWVGRIGMVVLPPIVYFITYRWAIALQRSDREVLEHGVETGIIRRLPQGAYIELHQPLGSVPLEYQGAAVPKRMNKLGAAGVPGAGGLLTADPASERELLTEAEHARDRRALTALRGRR
jgi:ubiquinol-cytochrome c reductase cytochrome b subunit